MQWRSFIEACCFINAVFAFKYCYLKVLLCTLAGDFHNWEMQVSSSRLKKSQDAGPCPDLWLCMGQPARSPGWLLCGHSVLHSHWQYMLLVKAAATMSLLCLHRHCGQREWSLEE